jgi:hypothetical protein
MSFLIHIRQINKVTQLPTYIGIIAQVDGRDNKFCPNGEISPKFYHTTQCNLHTKCLIQLFTFFQFTFLIRNYLQFLSLLKF